MPEPAVACVRSRTAWGVVFPVARCDPPPTRTSRGSTPPSEGPCEGGTPTVSLSTPGSPNPRLSTRPCALLVCECASSPNPSSACVRVRVCVCVCVGVCEFTKSLVCVCTCACVRLRSDPEPASGRRRSMRRAGGSASQLNHESARSHHYNNNPGASASRWTERLKKAAD